MQNALNAIFGGRQKEGQSAERGDRQGNAPLQGRAGGISAPGGGYIRASDARGMMPREGAEGGDVPGAGHGRGLFYNEQMQLFQKRTAEFLRQSFPSFAGTLTEAEQEKLAVNAQKRAGLRGFMTEKEIWHYLIAAVYCGFFFESDPQYADMLTSIGWQNEDADRALLLDRLLSSVEEYSQQCEADFADFSRKISYLAEFYADSRFSSAVIGALPSVEQYGVAGQMLDTVFPARAALWSAEARQNVIGAGLEQAQRLGLGAKEGMLYCVAAVYFGRGFEQSPLYPWAHALCSRNIPAEARIKQFIAAAAKHFQALAE